MEKRYYIDGKCVLSYDDDVFSTDDDYTNIKELFIYPAVDKVQFTRDYTGEVSDGRGAASQIFHVMFKLSLVAAMVVIIKSTTRRLSSKDTFSQVSR